MIAKDSNILIIGDGDFSYSAELLSCHSGPCLTSTVFLSQKDLVELYGEGRFYLVVIHLCIII